MIPYDTLLDAARLHFDRASRSPNFTREARTLARKCAVEAQAELDEANSGRPLRTLCDLHWHPHIPI